MDTTKSPEFERSLISNTLLIVSLLAGAALAVMLVMSGCSPSPRTRQASRVEYFGNAAVLEACDAGEKAFSSTVYPLIRNNCTFCHENGPGPGFAVADVDASYTRFSAFANFDALDQSIVLGKMGDGHCKEHCVTPAAMRDLLQKWWDGGESTCPRRGRFFSSAKALPADLPGPGGATFSRMKWDLGEILPDLKGAIFELEVQKLANATESNPGAYRFRKPRLSYEDDAVYLRGIRVLVNGKFDTLANSYLGVDTTVESSPVLSSKQLILLQDHDQGDQISVSFEDLHATAHLKCRNLAGFTQNVLPTMKVRGCFGCHSGGADQAPGVEAARGRFDMSGTESELCVKAFERSDLNLPMSSAIIDYPLEQVNGHPRILLRPDEVRPAWTDWITGSR